MSDTDFKEAIEFIVKVIEEKCPSYCCDEPDERKAIAEEIVKAIIKANGLKIDDPNISMGGFPDEQGSSKGVFPDEPEPTL